MEIPCMADVNVSVNGGPDGVGVTEGAAVGNRVANGVGNGVPVGVGVDVWERVAVGAAGATDVQEYRVIATTKAATVVGLRRS